MLYPNQPLTSVAIEIRFRGDLGVERSRAQIQQKVRDAYPNLFVPNIDPNVAPATQPFRFEDDARKNGIQFSICNFGIYSRDYPGHKALIAELTRVLSIFAKDLDPLRVTRIGWRYINEMAFTREQEKIPVHRFLSKSGPMGFAVSADTLAMSYKVLLEEKDARLNVRLDSKDHTEQMGHEALFFDIDIFKEYSPGIEMDQQKIIWHIQRLHGSAYRFFEGSINSTYRSYLKGETS